MAYAEAQGGRHSAEAVLKHLYGDDRGTQAVLAKAAVLAATTATTGWADLLAENATADFVASLAPASAAAKLIERAPRIDMASLQSVLFPRRSGQPAALPFVKEGSPIPVRNPSVAAVELGPPAKVAGIAVFSRRLAQSASGEVIFSQLLREDAAYGLDAGIFSTAAASDTRPAGILNGLTPVTATPGGDSAGRWADMRNLAAAVATSGAAEVVFVASPRQAFIAQMATDITATVWASPALADGVVIALDPAAFVSGFDAKPEIIVSNAGTVHMEGATPAEIVSGTGPTTANPVRELWQTDCLAARIILDASWAMRATGSVAYLTGADWG